MKKSLISLKVNKTIDLCKDKNLLILVSGGSDSMALLHWANSNISYNHIHALFVSYRTRVEQNKEEFINIVNFCKDNNINFHFYEEEIKRKNQNFQDRAREIRYKKAEEIWFDKNIDFILTGHNVQDKIETYFIKKIQKRNMSYKTIQFCSFFNNKVKILRPFLDIDKKKLINYNHNNNIPYVVDESNYSNKYLRNRIRRKVDLLTEKELFSISSKIDKEEIHIQKGKFLGNDIRQIKSSIYWKQEATFDILNRGLKISKGQLIEIEKLLNGKNNKKQLLLKENIYLVIIDRKIYLYELSKYDEYGSSLPRFRKINKKDFIIKSEGKRNLIKELKNSKIPSIVRNNIFVLEFEGRIVAIESLLLK